MSATALHNFTPSSTASGYAEEIAASGVLAQQQVGTILPESLHFSPISAQPAQVHDIAEPGEFAQIDATANIRESNFDWIFQDAGSAANLDSFGFPMANFAFLDQQTDFNQQFSRVAAPPNAQEPAAKYYKGNGAQRNKESWILDASEPTMGQSIVLPELGGRTQLGSPSLTGSYFQLPPVDDSDRNRITQTIAALLERPLWTAVSLANFPSKGKLDHCIDVFFVNFHPVRVISPDTPKD